MENSGKKKRRLHEARRPVIQRYWRRKCYRQAHALARAYMRWKLPLIERDNRKNLEKAFESVRRLAERNAHGKMSAIATLSNISLYLLIALRDIQAFKIDALTHSDEWKRKLCARLILLTIYEWDADSVSGQAFREALDLMQVSDDLRQAATDSLRQLRKIQKKANTNFAAIRNSAIAHRDPNALVQWRAIQDLNVSDVFSIGAEFFAEAEHFVSVQTRLMRFGSTPQSLLRQWFANSSAMR